MKDHLSPQDEEIIRQLKSLDRSSPDYPAKAFEKRRASFREAASGLILGVPAIGFLKGRFNFLGHLSAKTLEAILIGTLVVVTGINAYLFRDEIRDWFTAEPTASVILQPTWTPRPTLTETPSPTPTMTMTTTPTIPTATLKTSSTNPGLHLGQTKTPKP